MKSEYINKQDAISLYKNGDCILRKSESTRQDEEGQVFYVYEEIQFKTDMSFSDIESKFDEVWLLQTKPQVSVEEKVIEHDEKIATIKEMIEVLFGGAE